MSTVSSTIDIKQELEDNRHRYLTLIDLDCFYAQVEAKRRNIDPSVPLAVQQWGAVIAVNYKSREFGVKRGDSLNEIKKKCPKIILCHVDVVNGNGEIIPGEFNKYYRENYKVTLELYREENFKILDIFRRFTLNVERASIDEAYIDLTDVVNDKYDKEYINMDIAHTDLSNGWMGNVIGGTFNPRNEHDIKLMICSQIVHEMRMAVLNDLHYSCSGGVAHNKKFAKMISSMNKPNGQSVLPTCGLTQLLSTTSFTKLQGFGGKLGQKLIDEFSVNTFSDITENVGLLRLMTLVDEGTALWIWRICHGIDKEDVKIVGNVKRIGSSKNLRGVYKLEEVTKHLKICASELLVRIRNDRKRFHRIPKTLAINYKTRAHGQKSVTTMMMYLPNDDILIKEHVKYSEMLTKHAAKSLPMENGMEYLNIGLSVSGFSDVPKHNIMAMWNKSTNNKMKNVRNKCNISLLGSGYEDEVKIKKKKLKVHGIERFLIKDAGRKVCNMNNNNNSDIQNESKSRKQRKRKGPLFEYLVDKNDNKPHLKRRKLNEVNDNDVLCDKCRKIICRKGDVDGDRLIQSHMDEHLALALSEEWNTVSTHSTIYNKTNKNKKENKNKKGIMNYFKHTK